MIVARQLSYKPDTGEATFLQVFEKPQPSRLILLVTLCNAQNAPEPVLVNTDGRQDRDVQRMG